MPERQEYRDGLDWLQPFANYPPFGLYLCLILSQARARICRHGDDHQSFASPQVTLLRSRRSQRRTIPSVHNFLDVRRESGHPVTFVNTKEEFEEILKSYP
jgi:hypothetical protein